MKLSCDVIQDLLPLYHDGVCSEESSRLVQAHLVECEACGAMLNALQGEIEAPYASGDEVKPLEKINKSIHRGKRRALCRGMLAAVALILVVALIGSGVWYNRIGKYYDAVADKMEPVTKEMSSMTSVTHYLGAGDYGVLLQKPLVFSDSGFIRVGSIDQTVNFLNGTYHEEAWDGEAYLDLFFYPDREGGYQFALFVSQQVLDEQDGSTGYYHRWFWVDPDLSLRFHDLEEQEEYMEFLEAYRAEIEALFAVVEEQFGISYLK